MLRVALVVSLLFRLVLVNLFHFWAISVWELQIHEIFSVDIAHARHFLNVGIRQLLNFLSLCFVFFDIIRKSLRLC